MQLPYALDFAASRRDLPQAFVTPVQSAADELQGIIRCLGGSLLMEEDVALLEHPAVPPASDPSWSRMGSVANLLHGPVASPLCRPDQASSMHALVDVKAPRAALPANACRSE